MKSKLSVRKNLISLPSLVPTQSCVGLRLALILTNPVPSPPTPAARENIIQTQIDIKKSSYKIHLIKFVVYIYGTHKIVPTPMQLNKAKREQITQNQGSLHIQ